MKRIFLTLLLVIAGQALGTGQEPTKHEAKPKSGLDLRVQGLEERLTSQQFEIDQLKKELLARDEEIHALSDMIGAEDSSSPGEDDSTFEAETDACRSTRYVRLPRTGGASGNNEKNHRSTPTIH